MPLSPTEAAEYERFLHRLADASGRAILPHFRKVIAVENKLSKGFDPVTEADRAAERAIRALIEQEYSGHGILGEEEGHAAGQSKLTWVIDPIDGTRSFMTGGPLWGTLIALNDGTRPVLGLLDQPFLRERFLGTPEGSSLHTQTGTQTLRTRSCAMLSDAILSTTHPELFHLGPEADGFTRLTRAVRMTRYGGDCYGYGLLAMGFIDLIVESGLKPYDIQALIPIIEGAGGIVTNWEGGDAQHGGRVVASGDIRLHDQALVALASG